VKAQPSTNVNRGTDETHVGKFQIDDRSRRSSGFSVSGELRLEKPILAGRNLLASVSLVTGVAFDTTTRQAMPMLRAEATLHRLIGPARSVSVTPYVEVAFARGELSRVQPGVKLNHDFTVGDNAVGLQLDISNVDYLQSSGHDGLAVRASAQVTRRLGENDKLNFTAQVSHDRRRSKYASGTGVQAEIEWEHRFENGLIGSAAAGIGARFHDADAPLTTERQLDVFATGSIALSHDKLMIGKIRPEIGYRYTHGWSNDAFSRFTAHDLTLEAKARF
jgi:hypothetical protein